MSVRAARVPLQQKDFDRMRALLHRAAGLATDGSRRAALTAAVDDLRVAARCGSVADYLALAERDPAERQRLIDAAVVGETHWLRTPPQVEALRTSVLPRLLAARRRSGLPLRVWSAGCSTGEEAWSLAMLVAKLDPDARVEVLGTDISTRALAAADAGIYGERALAAVSPRQRARWLEPLGDGRWRVGAALRTRVSFRRHDLVHEQPPCGDGSRAEGLLDVVLCRNVTIYFDRATTRALVERIAGVLAPDGVLLLGHSETLWQVSDAFRVERLGDAFLYRPAASPDGTGLRRAPVAVPRPRPHPPLPDAPAAVAVRAALAAGDYAAAERLAAACVLAQPLDGVAHYLHGLALVNLGRPIEAVGSLRRAVYAEPADGFAQFLLATALASCGQPAAARTAYAAAAVALDRRSPQAPPAPELDGRSVTELAALCRSLAETT